MKLLWKENPMGGPVGAKSRACCYANATNGYIVLHQASYHVNGHNVLYNFSARQAISTIGKCHWRSYAAPPLYAGGATHVGPLEVWRYAYFVVVLQFSSVLGVGHLVLVTCDVKNEPFDIIFTNMIVGPPAAKMG